MENLNRVIAAYTAMDQRSRQQILRHMEWLAKAHPRRESLRLVACDGRVNDFGKPLRVTS